MCTSEKPFLGFRKHRARYGGSPRTFSDFNQHTMTGMADPAGSSSQHSGHGPNRRMGQRSNLQASEHPSRLIRVYRDMGRNIPDPEDNNRQPRSQQRTGAPPEVIIIS